jgi:hypothetical protein
MLSIDVVNLYCFFLSDQEEPKLSGRAPTWSGVGVASIGACRTGGIQSTGLEGDRGHQWEGVGVAQSEGSGGGNSWQAMGGGRARCERLCEMWARPGADGCTHVDRIHLTYDN